MSIHNLFPEKQKLLQEDFLRSNHELERMADRK